MDSNIAERSIQEQPDMIISIANIKADHNQKDLETSPADSPYSESLAISQALEDVVQNQGLDSTLLASLRIAPERNAIETDRLRSLQLEISEPLERSRFEKAGLKFGPGDQIRNKNGEPILLRDLKPKAR